MVAADVAAEVDVIANVFAAAQVDLVGLVGVDVTAELDAIVAVNVNLLVVCGPLFGLYSQIVMCMLD